MKLHRILATAALAVCISTTAAFAAPNTVNLSKDTTQQKNDTLKKEKNSPGDKHSKDRHGSCRNPKDPLKVLEHKKSEVQVMLKEGKITKAQADAVTAVIDAKIKDIKEFNSLPLQQKKDKLIKDFKANVARKVKDGTLTQDKADELVKDFTGKIEKWDGNGYPQFHKKEFKKEFRQDDRKDIQPKG